MKMPTLIITKHSGSIPIRGKCSSCREVKFSTEGKVGTAAEHLNALHEEFKLHFEDVPHARGRHPSCCPDRAGINAG